ncbi:MAG: glycosyltransferase [Firmicutes bacterium]|nr:glycosyltransferase [Bacillota bacterium]
MKKRLLFTAYNLDLGGIETALVNLLNRINYDKYEVTLVLEKKEGILLDKLDKRVNVREVKVSNSKNIVVRKTLNFARKLIFKIFNYHKYDFSCCYATYSYSSSKLALIGSKNSSLYVHSDYRNIYNEDEFYKFFNSRNVDQYRKIIFVSNESKDGFIEKYSSLSNKCLVFNNFIDVDEVIKNSNENISINKSKNKLLVFVGRLDDNSKKVSRQINLVKNIDNLDLWIVGDGSDRSKYEQEVVDNKLEDRVIFLGAKKNPFPYMKQADYIILTSDYEGFPVTYLEAIALNKKIITTIGVSDSDIDISKYAFIIDKDKEMMIKEVKDIIKTNKKIDYIDIEEIQKKRIKKIEEVFDEVI